MSILTTAETKNKIAEQAAQAKENLHIISAFCKVTALEFVDKNITKQLESKKILVRFLLSDILQGATDFELYEYCKTNGWQLYIRFDLHAKTYVFDRERCILGSANLTSKGLGINFHGNYELSCFAEIDDADLVKIDALFDNAILMTDELYKKMTSEYEAVNENASVHGHSIQWSDDVKARFNPIIDTLFTYDFPQLQSPDYTAVDCFDFLGLSYVPSQEELREVFRWSKSFLWLYNFINSSPEKTSYFGAVAASLHDLLIHDPKPYRKEVKELLANLLGWIQELEIEDIAIDVPNYSKRIRVVSNLCV